MCAKVAAEVDGVARAQGKRGSSIKLKKMEKGYPTVLELMLLSGTPTMSGEQNQKDDIAVVNSTPHLGLADRRKRVENLI